MKIKEILELTFTEPLNKIAKERLTIGEKPTRNALKKAGCYSLSGKKGWHFDGDKSVLEQSIYDFSEPKKINRKAKANVSSKEVKNEKTKEQNNNSAKEEIKKGSEQIAPTVEKAKANVSSKTQKKETTNVGTLEPTNESSNVVRKRASFDLDVDLLKQLKIQAVVQDKNIYEMVETAIRKYLNELK
ncbi:hypothetical protein [Metabacillus sp. FJAT-52054]|uniref:CopG family transcriptional regulator n=1 Tax=Metabacillus sediminis TaxID=3117746 RepID=A0ABZ2NP53_9BACI